MIQFPALDITDNDWGSSAHVPLYFDPYVSLGPFTDFEKECKDRILCDSNGNVFSVIDMVPANSKWRKVIGFIPGVYRVKLVFKQLDFQIGVEDLRNFMIGCLRLTRNSKAYDYLIYDLKSARTHQELFGERRT